MTSEVSQRRTNAAASEDVPKEAKQAKAEHPRLRKESIAGKSLEFTYNTIVILLLVSAFWFFIRGEATFNWFPKGPRHLEKEAAKARTTAAEKFGPFKTDDKGFYVFTPSQLRHFDGTDEKLPIYIAIDSKVFDVTKGRQFYGPDGSYSIFAGRDATRAFITGCFETHLTHDLRGLTQDKADSLQKWVAFFEKSEKYKFVGRVENPPIDPDSPIPEDC